MADYGMIGNPTSVDTRAPLASFLSPEDIEALRRVGGPAMPAGQEFLPVEPGRQLGPVAPPNFQTVGGPTGSKPDDWVGPHRSSGGALVPSPGGGALVPMEPPDWKARWGSKAADLLAKAKGSPYAAAALAGLGLGAGGAGIGAMRRPSEEEAAAMYAMLMDPNTPPALRAQAMAELEQDTEGGLEKGVEYGLKAGALGGLAGGAAGLTNYGDLGNTKGMAAALDEAAEAAGDAKGTKGLKEKTKSLKNQAFAARDAVHGSDSKLADRLAKRGPGALRRAGKYGALGGIVGALGGAGYGLGRESDAEEAMLADAMARYGDPF